MTEANRQIEWRDWFIVATEIALIYIAQQYLWGWIDYSFGNAFSLVATPVFASGIARAIGVLMTTALVAGLMLRNRETIASWFRLPNPRDVPWILLVFAVVVPFAADRVLASAYNFLEYTPAEAEYYQRWGSFFRNVGPLSIVLWFLPSVIGEEIIYRGFMLGRLTVVAKGGVVGPIAVSTVLFVASHHAPGIIPNLQLFIGGVADAIVYLRTRNLVYPIATHLTYNYLCYAVYE